MQNEDYDFVVRTSNKEKIRAFTILLIIVIVVLILTSYVTPKLYRYWLGGDEDKSITSLVKERLTDVSNPLGLLLMSFVGASIFIPMPVELFYWLGLTNGSSILFSFLAVGVGCISMQFINYWLGLRLSYFFFTFVSKRKVYAIRRKVDKYGAWAVFLLNVTPSPAELLTFALGITRYNKTRLFVVLSFAILLKYIAITLFYIIFFR
jgi:membrane protein YqaA with SNARE-associated domain